MHIEYRVQTVIERTGREEKSAQKLVKKVDKERRTYYEYLQIRNGKIFPSIIWHLTAVNLSRIKL